MKDKESKSFTKQIKRYAQVGGVVGTLAAKIVSQKYLGIKLDKNKHAAEIRASLGNIKGPLMKIAQLSATIPDLLPPEYAQELIHLQSNRFQQYDICCIYYDNLIEQPNKEMSKICSFLNRHPHDSMSEIIASETKDVEFRSQRIMKMNYINSGIKDNIFFDRLLSKYLLFFLNFLTLLRTCDKTNRFAKISS